MSQFEVSWFSAERNGQETLTVSPGHQRGAEEVVSLSLLSTYVKTRLPFDP